MEYEKINAQSVQGILSLKEESQQAFDIADEMLFEVLQKEKRT